MVNIFIINPKAGKGKDAIELVKNITTYFEKNGGNYKILYTSKQGDATKLAQQVCRENAYVNVFACGGDGTTYEVLNGIIGFNNVSMGIIPCGTGNDFIKFFDDRNAFLDIVNQLSGETVQLDVIKMGERVALNSCSVGMDAMVADNVRLFKKLPISASMAYIFSVVYTAFKKFNSSLELTIDGEKIGKIPCLFAVCANAPYYGGGFKCAPLASPGDGKLDFSIIESKSKLQVVKILGHYRKGTHIQLPNCRYGNCSSMEIRCDKPVAINLDGEIVYDSHAKFELLKNAVSFILPKSLVQSHKDLIKEKATKSN